MVSGGRNHSSPFYDLYRRCQVAHYKYMVCEDPERQSWIDDFMSEFFKVTDDELAQLFIEATASGDEVPLNQVDRLKSMLNKNGDGKC